MTNMVTFESMTDKLEIVGKQLRQSLRYYDFSMVAMVLSFICLVFSHFNKEYAVDVLNAACSFAMLAYILRCAAGSSQNKAMNAQIEFSNELLELNKSLQDK